MYSPKQIACEEEATALSEFEKVDDVLSAFVSHKNRKSNNVRTEDKK